MTEPLALAGLSILVTRPEPAGERLCLRLAQLGAYCEAIALLEIQPLLPSPAAISAALSPAPDALIFVSAAAVMYGVPLLRKQQAALLRKTLYAVGPSTACQLEERGLTALTPATASSEGLLDMASLQSVQRVLIVRGQGGRELLAQTLQERGCEVAYLEVYQRVLPAASTLRIATLLDAQPQLIVLITSAESLHHWRHCAGQRWLQHRLLVISPRLAELAAEQGAPDIIVAAGARDDDIESALLAVAAASSTRV